MNEKGDFDLSAVPAEAKADGSSEQLLDAVKTDVLPTPAEKAELSGQPVPEPEPLTQ